MRGAVARDAKSPAGRSRFDLHLHAPGRVVDEMSGEQPGRPGRVVLGREPEAHLRRGDGDELVRGLAHPRGIDPEHRDRRRRPQAFGDRARADRARRPAGSAPPAGAPPRSSPRPPTANAPAPRSRRCPLVVQRGEEAGQARERVGDRAPERAAVHREVERPDRDPAVDHPADARLERRGSPCASCRRPRRRSRRPRAGPCVRRSGTADARRSTPPRPRRGPSPSPADPRPTRGAPPHGSRCRTCRPTSPCRTAGRRGPAARTAGSSTARAGPPAARRGGRRAGSSVCRPVPRPRRTPPGARRRRAARSAGRRRIPRPRGAPRSPSRTPAPVPRRSRGTRSTGSRSGARGPRSLADGVPRPPSAARRRSGDPAWARTIPRSRATARGG